MFGSCTSTLSLFHLGINFSTLMLCQCVCVLGKILKLSMYTINDFTFNRLMWMSKLLLFQFQVYCHSNQYEWSEGAIKSRLCKCKTKEKVNAKRKENEVCIKDSKSPTWPGTAKEKEFHTIMWYNKECFPQSRYSNT